jgi:hypothetical protein
MTKLCQLPHDAEKTERLIVPTTCTRARGVHTSAAFRIHAFPARSNKCTPRVPYWANGVADPLDRARRARARELRLGPVLIPPGSEPAGRPVPRRRRADGGTEQPTREHPRSVARPRG